MSLTRRDFMKSFGFFLASMVLSGCVSHRDKADTPRDRLRICWQRLDWLAEQTQQASKAKQGEDALKRGEDARSQLVADHRQALDELVEAGDLDKAVAAQVQVAFGAAAYHVWRSNAPITCYEPVMVDYAPVTSAQLGQQAAILAQGKDLDPNTVAQMQAAIARDIAFLALTNTDRQALYTRLIQASQEGQAIPQFDQLELEVSPDAAQAAQFLVELLWNQEV
jgi:hypothetical protein